ncbi:MAG: polysaccharide biosynthesis tyrosine autokinase, partial [Burkholderiales bacterium]
SKAEQALQAFRERQQIVSVGGARGFVEQELTDNAMRLREAGKRKAELASTYWKIEQAGGDPKALEAASTLLVSTVVQVAKAEMLQASQKLKGLESRYGPKHPQMVTAQAELDATTAAYNQQLQTAALGVKAEYEIARETERQLSQIEQTARGQIQSLDRKEYEFSTLERDVETNRELYNLFLTRFKETDPTGGGDYQAFNARVVDPAIVPESPFKPNKLKFLLLAGVGGLFLGLLAAVLRYLLSDTIGSSQELEQLTGLPILGVLPVLEDIKPGKTSTVLDQPKSSFSEGMRSIRTGLVLNDLDQKKKRLIITSSAPQEGKTTVALNLAVTLGQMERVLVVDCDLRRPMLGKVVGLTSAKPGLTELLSELVKPENCIHRYEPGNIDVLPVGKLPPNPGEILASQRFRKLIEVLSARYDRIVFDSAPCQAVSDTLLLAQNADAVLFVVKSEKTTRGLVRHSIRQLR